MPPMGTLVRIKHGEDTVPEVAEFFAGIGLVRIGLEAAGFDVVWSNDIEPAKQAMYTGHFPQVDPFHTFVLDDIANVTGADIPTTIALAWASFPCVDLSLAGRRRGLDGSRSATFWHFTRILEEMKDARPGVVVLENVVGLATAGGGSDLTAAIRELNVLGYSADVLTLDARRFVPQSRPRLFIVGAKQVPIDQTTDTTVLRPAWLQAPFLDPSLITHQARLPEPPPVLVSGLATIVEQLTDDDSRWWDTERTDAFIASLSTMQLERLTRLRSSSTLMYRTAYRRTRGGRAVWEIRQDAISGCLRTARGGSSKQALVQIRNGVVRVRWMTPHEYARLMGAGEYQLHALRRNQALFGFGDAVCVPVVEWLATHYLMPLVRGELSDSPVLPLAAAGV